MNVGSLALATTRAGSIALGGFVFFTAFACAAPPAYRIVKKTQYDGVLALYRPNDGEARQEIDRAMREHCRGEYEVLEEGEVVVGKDEVVQSNQTQNTQAVGVHGRTWGTGSSTQTQGNQVTQVRDATEYRLTYRCKVGGAQPTSAPAPATPPAAPPTVGVPVTPRAEEVHVLRIRRF